MTIYDDILNKAQSQQDLQDVVQYLKKPLHLLQELQAQIDSLSRVEKNSISNVEIQKKINNILHTYLPGMLEEYCKFSLEYRNIHIMKHDSNAKELLLKNIAKITEETLVLQEDFHESNKFKFLVHEKIVSDLGFARDILGHKKPMVALKNQFDYQQYIATHDEIFRKPFISQENDNINMVQDIIHDATKNVSHTMLTVLTIVLIAMAGYKISGAMAEKYRLDYSYNEITQLKNNLEVLGASSANYDFVENPTIIKSSLPHYSGKNIFDGDIKIEPYTKVHKNDSYRITYLNVPQKTCRILKNSLKVHFKDVQVNNSKNTCSEINSLSFIETT